MVLGEFLYAIFLGVGSNPTSWVSCPYKPKSDDEGRCPNIKGKNLKCFSINNKYRL